MNIEFNYSLLLGSIVFGLVLAVPGLWWAKRKARSLPNNVAGAMRITGVGFVFAFVLVAVIILVYGLEYIAPGLSPESRVLLRVMLIVCSIVGVFIVDRLGIKITEKKCDKDE